MIGYDEPGLASGFRALVESLLGMHAEGVPAGELEGLARERLRAVRARELDEYARKLTEPDARRAEAHAIAARIAVGETYFFREPSHLRALTSVITRGRAGTPLRVLSAGCSTGEEAYSVAMHLRDAAPDVAARAEILAVDANPHALERARAARYSRWSLRATPDEIRERYFRPAGDGFDLDPGVRAAVTFDLRNLHEDDPNWPAPGAFDVIFCRNVIMYLAPAALRALVRRLERALTPGGYLLLGHSETLANAGTGLVACALDLDGGAFGYRKPDGPPRHATPFPALPTPPRASEPGTDWVDAIAASTRRVHALTRFESPALSAQRDEGTLAAAREHFRRERFDDALAALDRLSPAVASRADALLLRAAVLTEAGRAAEAEPACRAAMDDASARAGAHYLLGVARASRDDLPGAIRHLEHATALDPTFAMPWLQLGILARRDGRSHAARAALATARRLLADESEDRIELYGGGFSRGALLGLCAGESRALGGAP